MYIKKTYWLFERSLTIVVSWPAMADVKSFIAIIMPTCVCGKQNVSPIDPKSKNQVTWNIAYSAFHNVQWLLRLKYVHASF